MAGAVRQDAATRLQKARVHALTTDLATAITAQQVGGRVGALPGWATAAHVQVHVFSLEPLRNCPQTRTEMSSSTSFYALRGHSDA